MTTRTWIGLCVLLILLAFQIGWAARSQDTTDRYIQSQTAKNAIAETYFNTKLDQMIQENERSYKSGKQHK